MTHEPLSRSELDDTSAGRCSPLLSEVGRDVGRRGFLPIETNLFDRVFIGAMCSVAIHLAWLRFIELYLPIWIGTALTLILMLVILQRG